MPKCLHNYYAVFTFIYTICSLSASKWPRLTYFCCAFCYKHFFLMLLMLVNQLGCSNRNQFMMERWWSFSRTKKPAKLRNGKFGITWKRRLRQIPQIIKNSLNTKNYWRFTKYSKIYARDAVPWNSLNRNQTFHTLKMFGFSLF